MSAISVDVVSDVVCPWCYIGKRNLDQAIAQWAQEQPESSVTVRWHPFFLNPDTPLEGAPYRPFLEQKFGGPEKLQAIWERISEAGREVGIAFAFEKIEERANTMLAHRLIHKAQQDGADVAALVEALFAAQFIEGRRIGRADFLAELAASVGMDGAEVARYLASAEDVAVVSAGAVEAQQAGITGVPFFIFNRRFAASGAQPPEALLQALRQAATT